jgi:peroxiredoxin
MSKKTDMDASNLTGLPAKFDKILKSLPEFKATAEAASAEELKQIIVVSEGNVFNMMTSKDNDTKLSGAKEIVKALSAPYSEAIKCQQAKIAYALHLLQSKGAELGDAESE